MCETYRFFVEDLTFCWGREAIEFGIDMQRPPMIFMVWPGVYSVPNGANVGIAALA